jgi:hypothetical protein
MMAVVSVVSAVVAWLSAGLRLKRMRVHRVLWNCAPGAD